MATRYAQLHQSPAGPGDARPTAAQILQDEDLEGKWQGKVIFITGAASGLGLETARVLAKTGASLYLAVRDPNSARTTLGNLLEQGHVNLLKVDLNSLESVRKCTADFQSATSRLDLLIENAGVMMVPEGVTADGFETHLGINHLAHFLLLQLLKPMLLASTTPEFQSRVVILSSIAHRASEPDPENPNALGDYNPWLAYANSKTANVWTAHQVERLYGSQGLHAWSVQPGPTGTALYRHMSEAEMAAGASDPVLKSIFKTVEQGAATTVWAAVAGALEGQGGKYLEDCQISRTWADSTGEWAPGHSSWAYDDDKAAKLWARSLEMVGHKE